MPGTTKRPSKYVELRTPRLNKPYNRFEVQYTVTETADGPGKTKYVYSGGSLVCPELLGLNKDWLHNHSAPLDQAASQEEKLRIRELYLKFPYWGHLIDNSIQKFNAANTRRCRKLVYDLRHGEVDHNAWKSVFKKAEWTEVKRDPINSRVETRAYLKQYPEYKRQPIIEFGGKKYCLIDPPLTANGEDQAKRANDVFHFLRNYMFPMPKRAYVSPLHRAIQTFHHGLNNIGIRPEDSHTLDALREKETGNCADILVDEPVVITPKGHQRLKRCPWMGDRRRCAKTGGESAQEDL